MKFKSPLAAYKSDLRGFYGSPRYVQQAESVGVAVGRSLRKTGQDIFNNFTGAEKEKESEELAHKRAMEIKWGKDQSGPKSNNSSTPSHEENMRTHGLKSYKETQVEDFMNRDFGGNKAGSRNIATKKGKKILKLPSYEEAWNKNLSNIQNEYKDLDAYKSDMGKIKKGDSRDKEREAVRASLNPTMKGSPVKHDPGNTIKSQANPTRGFMSDITARVNAIKSQGPARGGVSAEDFASGNYAKPADAIDATSADTFAPPPNQVAETGSYSGGRDRILEMDSNPVINQSIGRDTDMASQLFGSGQRASMLAMKGMIKYKKSK